MLELSAPQHIFLHGLKSKFKAFVGGFGSGKTFVGCLMLLFFFARHPKTIQGYFAPTYPQIRDIFFPTFEEAAHLLGFWCDIKETNKEIHVYRGKAYYGTVICRSMDKPSSIVGFKIVNALVDEIDTLPKAKAKLAWDKIIARLRIKIAGVQNQIGVTTTPEGFQFVYDTFACNPSESYSMVQASTYENLKHLPDDYISSMIETYSAELVKAYVNGDFVNLTSGTVYSNFHRVLNGCNDVADDFEPLFIGMDFNVMAMSAIVHVERAVDGENQPRAVDEMVGIYDTPEMIRAIIARYKSKPEQAGRAIHIFPDQSGNSRKTVNAGETDVSLLEQAGFFVHKDGSNPAVRDRINSMNCAFLNGQGQRKYKVNVERCPTYAGNLEQQAFDAAGEPDKKHGKDHTNDAGGYFICSRYPITKPMTKLKVNFTL